MTPRAEADLEWILRFVRIFLTVWLWLAGLWIVFAVLAFVGLAGACSTLAPALPSLKSSSGISSDSDLSKERVEIERQLNSHKSTSTAVTFPDPSQVVLKSSDVAARALTDRIIQDVSDGQKKAQQEIRASYQGFPGRYDADNQPYQKMKK